MSLLQKIKEEVLAGNVNETRHPDLPLSIFKYAKQCVYAGSWNETNLLCRGIVLDDDGNIVINPMPKFFNHSEQRGVEISKKNKDIPYVVTDKLDGSLINVAVYKDNLIVCSSGSFISAQAQKARELIKQLDLAKKFEVGLTYCFEIIYPENKIVLNYQDRVSLDILSIRETKTGNDSQFKLVKDGFIKRENISTEEILKELPRDNFINKEGYIVTFENGDRIKYKYDEYVRLHKIVSGINEKFVWESMRDGIDLSTVLENAPDELYTFIDETKATLKTQFDSIVSRCEEASKAVETFKTRKEIALHLKGFYPDVMKFVFLMLDKKDVAGAIWKEIEPENLRCGMGEKTVDKTAG